MNKKISIVLVDDHAMLRKGLSKLVADLYYEVLYECRNGKELVDKIGKKDLPDLIIMDTNMPQMNGFETVHWIKQNYPVVKVLILGMEDDEKSIIRMFRNGAKGYILKDIDADELKQAVDSIIATGFYYYDAISGMSICSNRER